MRDENYFCQLVAECSDAIVVSDRKGIITLWNLAAQKLFGFSAEEAVGASLDIFIPENLRARHWEGYFKVMESGVTRYSSQLLAAPSLCKDGRRVSTEFSMTLLKNEAGEVTDAVAVMRDVTDRWQKEKALRARLAELEKTMNNEQ